MLHNPENLKCLDGLIQRISNPFIEALTVGLGCRGDCGVNARLNTQVNSVRLICRPQAILTRVRCGLNDRILDIQKLYSFKQNSS